MLAYRFVEIAHNNEDYTKIAIQTFRLYSNSAHYKVSLSDLELVKNVLV